MSHALDMARQLRVQERWIGEIDRELNPVIERPLTSASGNDHSWRFEQTGANAGTVTPGKVFIGGVLNGITSWPTGGELTGVTQTTYYWLAINFSTATATWASDAADPETDHDATYPLSTATVEIWPILELTCEDGAIASPFECYPSDIHAMLNP